MARPISAGGRDHAEPPSRRRSPSPSACASSSTIASGMNGTRRYGHPSPLRRKRRRLRRAPALTVHKRPASLDSRPDATCAPSATRDLETSAVGFGTWALGSDWWGEHEDARRASSPRALDLGITFFDTGDTYGQGAQRGARRPGAGALRPRPRRLRAVDQVRLRARRRAQGPQGVRAPARLVAGAHPARARGLAAAPAHRLRRPLPAPQPAHGRASSADDAVRRARGAARPRARSATTGRARARRSAGATRACARSTSATV